MMFWKDQFCMIDLPFHHSWIHFQPENFSKCPTHDSRISLTTDVTNAKPSTLNWPPSIIIKTSDISTVHHSITVYRPGFWWSCFHIFLENFPRLGCEHPVVGEIFERCSNINFNLLTLRIGSFGVDQKKNYILFPSTVGPGSLPTVLPGRCPNHKR